jgi:hypothetical protein
MHLVANATAVAVSAKDENGALAVAPRQVSEQLIDGRLKLLRPMPKLALRDKNVSIPVPNEDVRLTAGIESFARCCSFVVSVELQKGELKGRIKGGAN